MPFYLRPSYFENHNYLPELSSFIISIKNTSFSKKWTLYFLREHGIKTGNILSNKLYLNSINKTTMKADKIKALKERLRNIYNELDDIKLNDSNQFTYSTQILRKMTQTTYYFDELIKELKMEDNSGNPQIRN